MVVDTFKRGTLLGGLSWPRMNDLSTTGQTTIMTIFYTRVCVRARTHAHTHAHTEGSLHAG